MSRWVKSAARHRIRLPFLRDTRGAAAVEFAMVVTPFLALTVGVVEIGVDFYVQAQIVSATQEAVKEIRTGSVQIKNLTREQFRDTVLCPKMSILKCEKAIINVAVVKEYWDWGAFSTQTVDPATVKWCTGNPRDMIAFQVAYPVPLTTMIWAGVTSIANGQRYYLATGAFRNEPFGVANPKGPGC